MSEGQDRTKILLLIGILIFGGVSVYLHLRLKAQREAAADARDNDPINRAKRAVQEADRATINGNAKRAKIQLEQARIAIEEAIRRTPNTPKLIHSHLVILRRQLHVAEQSKNIQAAKKFARESVQLAETIFASHRTQSRARSDLLATARELASLDSISSEEASRVLRSAAEKVDASVRSVKATSGVQLQLAKTWIQVARRDASREQAQGAMTAAHRAIELTRQPSDTAEPISVLSTTYLMATTAVDLAEKLKRPTDQESFEKLAVDTMKARVKLQPLKLILGQILGSRLNRLADLVDSRGDRSAALELKMEATQHLRSLHTKHPKDQKLRWSFVRVLNELGAFYSSQDKDKNALQAYKEASEVASTLSLEAARTRLLTMGNYAQLLGRLDQIKAARKIAKHAYEFAQKIIESKKDTKSIEDAANAELRYARLLRARPGAQRKRARTVAQAAEARLKTLEGPPSKRNERIKKGLNDLLKELK